MGMLKCPECKKRFSDKASACPSCGAPLALAIQADEAKKKKNALVVAAIATLFLAYLIFGGLGDGGRGKGKALTSAHGLEKEISARSGSDKAEVALAQKPVDPVKVQEENRTQAKAKSSEYVAQLERELAAIPTAIASKYTGDITALNTGLVLISAWASIYEQGDTVDLDENAKQKREQFRRAVSKKQAEMLPALRNAYGPLMRAKLWEADASAKTLGTGFRTVEFVSGTFARNANIKETHNQVREMLTMLRFNKAVYKWYAYDSEYTYYSIYSPKDSELVKWGYSGTYTLLGQTSRGKQ